ncbi:bromodomain containing 8 [Haematobia irritans]|uniref:bromodomain containing 8 n=1 Tax=Haematobia irritans TaxID=7368 RepID=UPI003F503758
MTSVQINRTPLDKWTTREQLALASAVLSSGDQNWMSVSRALKVLCGNSKDTLHPRPADWFSQKNCAVQYGHLLEDVETPKRKKRTSESSMSSSPPVEAPTEAVLRRLTEERMQELKLELRKEQEEYAKLVGEIKAIQSGNVDDEQLLEMWNDIEKEQDMIRIEEMRMENQMRERELRKQDLQRSWRSGGAIPSNSSSSSSMKSSTDTTAVDMDVEDIIGSTKPQTPTSIQVPPGTSPLLSSLLKSPTSSTPTNNVVSSSARASAPTITTLLTGGSIPNNNQPAIIPSRDTAVQLLARPLSGPPVDTISLPSSTQQNLLSPSQSAPTLSMLLEKNKSPSVIAAETKNVDLCSVKDNETTLENDSNNESIPMDIEEELPTTSRIEQDTDLQSDDIDDTDPNEEQQLMEVFKNIGNIEELDIDVSAVINEEVDFLKGVDEEDAAIEDNDLGQKLEDNEVSASNTKDIQETPTDGMEDNAGQNIEAKVDLISSDDSNDNLPLAAVASLSSSKDRLNESSNESSFLKEEGESAFPKNEADDQVDLENESTTVAIKQEMLDEHEAEQLTTDSCNDEGEKIESMEDNKNEDVFVMPNVEEGKSIIMVKSENEENHIGDNAQEQGDSKTFSETSETNAESDHPSEQSESNEHQSSSVVILQPPPAISIADTDENSSSTDISVQTRKDEKVITKRQSIHQRKSPNDAKTDDDMPNPFTQMVGPSSSGGNLTPRPTALRKLRDRDRSESPMIDDDATTQSDHSTNANHRSRRRYSSTPVIDSVPNSPASSDRDESRDSRTYKKSLLSIYNVLQNSKHASTIQRIVTDDTSAYKLENICLKPIDFVGIKRNIESGNTRTVYELQRDVLLMCQNALFLTKTSSSTTKIILAFQQECQNIREFMPNFCDPQIKLDRETRDTKSSGSTSSSTGGGSTSKGRSGSRKSLRLS